MAGIKSGIRRRLYPCATRLLGSLSFDFFYRKLENRLTSIFYHLISDSESPFTKHLYCHRSISGFENDLDYMAKRFNFVSFAELLNHYEKGSSLPKHAAFLSFDDGHRELAEVAAPILLKKGIPATFFIVQELIDNKHILYAHKKSFIIEKVIEKNHRDEPIFGRLNEALPISTAQPDDIIGSLYRLNPYRDRRIIDSISSKFEIDWNYIAKKYCPYITYDQIHSLIDKQFHVGSHGMNHIKFQFLPDKERERQVNDSMNYFQSNFGIDKIGFSFPNSHADISHQWMRSMIAKDPRIGLFLGTAGLLADDMPLVNRLGLESNIFAGHQHREIQSRLKSSCINSFIKN